MHAIILDDNQTSVLTESREAVELRDSVGMLLGHVVPQGVGNSNGDGDHWVECWNEWYLAIDEPELLVAG